MVRADTRIAHRVEHSVTLDGFRGVDLTSSPLRVSPRRATACRNLLPTGGRNVKRCGWRQEAYFCDADGAPKPVHGMWWYVWSATGQETRFLIVHVGRELYASRDGGEFYYISDGMEDEASEAITFNKRLYILGHKVYSAFGTWDGGATFGLRAVANDEDTYVPMTTIGINPTTDDEGRATEDTRRTLDAANFLCSKRINRCMGRKFGNQAIKLRLDAACENISDMSILVELADKSGHTYTETWRPVFIKDQNVSGEAWIFAENDIPEDGEPTAHRKGTVFYGEKYVAQVWLEVDCPPPVEGRDNITITFTPALPAASDHIDGCRFGVMFGGGGNAERLILSGNKRHPNIEYCSAWRNPTYFPDNGYNSVGSDATAVVGFSRISDGVLAVFKEEGRGEPVIYYHTATDEPVYDDDGKLEAMRFQLFTDAGNAGEGMVSRLASVDFFGDPLILSRNGVFALSYKTNVETADRYAAERSRNIRSGLLSRDLSRACGVVYEKRYWLAVDGVCYVADADYTFRPEENSSGYQYEWWVLDHIPATFFCVANDRLYFGTDDGRVCCFLSQAEQTERVRGEDKFRDVSWVPWTAAATVDAEDFSQIVMSEQFFSTLRINDRLLFDSKTYAICLEADAYTVMGGCVVLVETDRIINIRDGQVVYADQVGDSGLVANIGYTVGDIDLGRGSFKLYNNRVPVYLQSDGFRLGVCLAGREVYVIELIPDEQKVGGNARVSLYEQGEPLTLMDYQGDVGKLFGRVVYVDNVTAEWFSPVVDLGTNTQTKTLTGLTVALEPGYGGRILFGYETRAVSRLVAQALGMGGFDLTNLDFNEFTLSSFAASWTARCCERQINYIMFYWRSDEPSDSRVDSITARYKITGNIRGGL